MSTERQKSAIQEVRDQLSLDFADGKYLNVLGNNYGLRRSDIDVASLNFDDNTWRALIKVIALQFKQIVTKFEEILAIVLGPKVTQVGTFAEDIEVGVFTFVANDTTQFPQVGTLVLDEGLITEESVEVCYIDRGTNTIYVTAPTQFEHQAVNQDAEQPITLDVLAGDTEIYVPFSEYFPSGDFPYTLVLGRGTSNEEIVELVGNNLSTNVLTITACTKSHAGQRPSQIQSTLFGDYVPGSYFLNLTSVKNFNETGEVLLGASSTSFTATGGSVSTVSVALATFTADRQVKNRVVFDGNVTAALAGVEANIASNTDALLTFQTPLGTAPVAGDTFSIRPVLEYTSVDLATSTINLRRDIVDYDLTFNTTVEVLTEESLVSLAPLKMEGAGWDVFQIDTPEGPPTVEILIPETFRSPEDLRSASYIHTTHITPDPVTTVVTANAAEKVFFVATNIDFPLVGVVTIQDPVERVGYSIDQATLAEDLPIGSTSVLLESGGEYFQLPFVAEISDGVFPAETVTVSAITGQSVTMSATTTEHLKGATLRATNYMRTGAEGLQETHPPGADIDLHQPPSLATAFLDGNLWTVDDVFPGPYLYNPNVLGIQQTETLLDSFLVSGPTQLSAYQQSGRTALEVEDASAFPHSVGFPLQVGYGSNVEIVDVNQVAYKQRTLGYTAVAAGIQPVGTSSLVLENLDQLTDLGFTGGSSAFPNANGYRVRLARGTASDEIVFVTSTNGVDTLTLESGTVYAHSPLETVELVADVLATDALVNDHVGIVDITSREVDVAGAGFPPFTNLNNVETSRPLYSSLPVADVTGLPTAGGEVYFNFGNNRIRAEATLTVATTPFTTTLSLSDTSIFPGGSPSAFPFVITINPGSVNEEVVEVIANDEVLNELTLASPAWRWPHAIGTLVSFTSGTETSFAYQAISGSSLEFTPSDTFAQTFYSGTTVTLSPGPDIPQVTGYDFPLTLPSDVEAALAAILNLVRAAGVLVVFIDQP